MYFSNEDLGDSNYNDPVITKSCNLILSLHVTDGIFQLLVIASKSYDVQTLM